MSEETHADLLETMISSLGAFDHHDVEWENVRWTAYLIHQHLRYEYPGQIRDLRQRLVIVPPERHGGQRLVTHKLEVSAPLVAIQRERDDFGNHVVRLSVDYVERAIDFTAWIVIERDATAGPIRLAAPADARFGVPSPLTMPDDTLRAVAAALQVEESDPLALAHRINAWVSDAMTYEYGPTDVRTPAAEALALRRGVCQDYAHVMLALCRLCGLPARYVSGHLLGEGGTHAWVEVLLPDAADPASVIAHPFDPTHGRIPRLNYLTIAVGRDYGDVAPTSGTFRAPYGGHLSAKKHAGLTAVEYFSDKR
ncbi:MAG: transglutaminase family protein [Chloroflexota bacterium]|nr:transglutaminase family protein [Chloroflexota bacterium]